MVIEVGLWWWWLFIGSGWQGGGGRYGWQFTVVVHTSLGKEERETDRVRIKK